MEVRIESVKVFLCWKTENSLVSNNGTLVGVNVGVGQGGVVHDEVLGVEE